MADEDSKGRFTPRRVLPVVVALCAVCAVAVIVLGHDADLDTLAIRTDSSVTDDVTSSDDCLDELAQDYPDLVAYVSRNDPRTYAIPGLVRAKNIRATSDTEGTIDYATDMTPQGVTVTDDYVIVSAYSESKEFHSVLWMLDRANGSFLKTVVLQGTDHVGGLAYDKEHDRLWVCATIKGEGKAGVGCLSLSSLEAYDFDTSRSCLPYDDTVALEGIKRTSFIALQDDTLYAGTFKKDGAGKLGCYRLDETGMPAAKASKIVSIPDQIQGISFCDDMIALSESYGTADSHLLLYKDTDVADLGDLTDRNCLFDVAAPPYLEQTTGDGNELYAIFESSAQTYRTRKGVVPIAHIIRFDLSGLNES